MSKKNLGARNIIRKCKKARGWKFYDECVWVSTFVSISDDFTASFDIFMYLHMIDIKYIYNHMLFLFISSS